MAVGREEFDRWKRLNFDVGELVCSRVHLGDDDVFVILELFACREHIMRREHNVQRVHTEFVPNRRELLAVAAPRRVKLDEHILLIVARDLVEVLADEHLDALFVPIVRNFLGHKMRLEFAVDIILRVLDDVLGRDVAERRLELDHFL